MVKIAVTGKGGVGKTTITAGLARAFSRRGYKVVALDVDPSPNLLSSLGCGENINLENVKPLMENADLVRERTGAPPEGYGLVFKLNPKVDDILDRFGIECKDGVKLLVVGTIKQGGGGCFCPANAFARRLVDYLSGGVDVLLMDMEAGVEHLGRGTTRTTEILLTVVEPSLKSVETAKHIKRLASDLGIKKVLAVELRKKRKYICPRCNKKALKWRAVGLWECESCGIQLAGGAWDPISDIGLRILMTIRRLKSQKKA